MLMRDDLPFLSFLAVLKRSKAKKGKNDLIGAEEGEDPFADISSVGMSQLHITSDLLLWSGQTTTLTRRYLCHLMHK